MRHNDPRDMAELRVYHQEQFLCRAVCQELAGQTISLKEMIRARNHRRLVLKALKDQARRRAPALVVCAPTTCQAR